MLAAVLVLSPLTLSAHVATYKKSFIDEAGTPGKYLMHLEGSPYEIGYAMGYLRPKEVVDYVHGEYIMSMFSFIRGDGYSDESDPAQGELVDALLRIPAVKLLLETVARGVPYEYRLEMKGIMDGTNDALGYKAVTYHQVMLVNVFPVLQSLTTSKQVMGLLELMFSDCNGYVAFGKATCDGRALMGRHLMWVGDPRYIHNYVIEYVPLLGKRFVSVASPGMVGINTGMNTAGIGFGCDYLNVVNAPKYPGGMGMWLLGRKIVQYASSVSEAESIIRRAKEIAPSLLIVGDAAGDGAVFEVYNRIVAPRYADWVSRDRNAPDPIEREDDLVVVSNHAFTRELYPLDPERSESSLRRYQVLTNLLLESYGKLDQTSGRAIIDFMHPPSEFYGDDPGQPVRQCVAFMDLDARTIWALYGNYDDPWVEFTLR
ncbi:MAG TPA: C45 family autoproteolytic acyltransferase/hydrolase [Deltaproteobacteria bacterium]|nr:C45 family autoproteolytic acyltransferase/hydrolase [Deltaproteobacteria bacterium]